MKDGHAFEIAHAEGFPLELGRAPRKVQHAYQRTVVPILRETPDHADSKQIKRLKGYKDLWRFRVSGDYRLVYRVDQGARIVTMLMLDNRSKVYERLGANREGEPGVRIVARAEELMEVEPTPEIVGRAIHELATTEAQPSTCAPDKALPERLEPKRLAGWSVPTEYNDVLKAIRTEGELLSAPIPEDVLERVMDGLWPRQIEEIVQEPVRVAVEPSAVEAAAEGLLSLESFLLKLDDDQRDFVSRFESGRPKGPWLLKGGPGSGKSTVALYCIESLVRGANAKLPLTDRPLRILFTTFTKSLVNASQHLLKMLDFQSGRHKIDIKNVDKLAWQFLPDNWKNSRVVESPLQYVQAALVDCKKHDPKFGFSEEDAEFLFEEVDWVLVGQGITSVEEYLQADRGGRGRALGQQQRRQVWLLFEACRRRMREAGVSLFSERLQQAAQRVAPAYDYVFIDEAQDLKPVAIRFCIGLCLDPNNVFLTADTNQSIYGNGLSWSKVASDLRFQGRARILRRNYRTTAEIWKAITQLAPNAQDADRETLEIETVFRGPYPILARYTNPKHMSERLNSYLHEALLLERVGPGCAAVLCRTGDEMGQVTQMIDVRFNAKVMHSSEVDLAHAGVKVLTMHAAKGLEFPVVAVVGVEAGKLPLPVPEGIDPTEHNAREHRLFFVACSRAMRRLIVFTNCARPSPFTGGLTDDLWEIEDL